MNGSRIPDLNLVPLTLTVGNENIIDDSTFDQADFLKKVADCPECPKSACPITGTIHEGFRL